MLHVNALGTWTVTDLPRAPRVMRGNARGGTLEYEHVGPALLHFEQVDFLDDGVGARAASPAILAISAAPSGQSRVGGNGGEGVGGQGEMVDVGGNRQQDKTSLFCGCAGRQETMSSLFAGVEDDCGDVFNNLQVKK